MVSEVGDHFNNIAVFGLVLATTKSGMAVAGVMLSRAIPAILAGPLAGVVLDRFDRKRVMITCELVQGAVLLVIALTLPVLPLLLALVAARAEVGRRDEREIGRAHV